MNRVKADYYSRYHQKDVVASSSKYEHFITLLSKYPTHRMLDVGCGDGSYAQLAAKELKCEVYGIDISKEAIEKFNSRGIKGFQLDVDSQDMPFNDNYFDCVFCGEIIEHVYSPDHLLKEVRRVLKSGGILLITTPNLGSWFNRVSLALGFQPVFSDTSLESNHGHFFSIPTMGHLRLYTLRALRGLLESYSFEVLVSEGIGINPRVGFGRRHPFVTIVANAIFGAPSLNSGILMLVRKKPGLKEQFLQ